MRKKMQHKQYKWICYVCGIERMYPRSKPPEKEPVEGVCAECRRTAFKFDLPLGFGCTEHNEHKDRKDAERVGRQFAYTILADMCRGYAPYTNSEGEHE